MYLNREQVHYESWTALWNHSQRSRHFQAGFHPESTRMDLPLSERLLFTQSNARVLLGQDSTGCLAFICAPHSRDYSIPTCATQTPLPITACPGMYDQTDVAMWLGKAGYLLELDDGQMFPAMENGCKTQYLDHFLPVSSIERNDLEIHVLTLAPFMEKDTWTTRKIPGTPLPGPSGAIYAIVLKNTGKDPISGKCRLTFDRKFVIRSEYNGQDPFEKDCVDPYFCEWERDFYTMWRPDACVSLHLLGAVHNQNASQPEMFVPFCLKPGEETTIQCSIAISPEKSGISETMGMIFQHDVLEWINVTDDFWMERLGKLQVNLDGPISLSEQYVDFQIRNVIDNFNCLQTDANGQLLVHWQGAPSHNIGRFWGIDIEPTVNSVLYAIPEFGPAALQYLMERNEPRFSIYSDHSTPIRASLLIVAAKYLELTGDVAYFQNHPHLMKAIHSTFERIMASKHKEHALFSSRYSSDGIVFHRYDVGTNAKVWLALRGYQRLLQALGETCPDNLEALCSRIRDDMLSKLVKDGPFGPQFIGGKTFDEDPSFYFRDDIFYYDGEDSTSCMMPVYGLFEFDEPAWKNYHRFARSLFLSNYDAEMRSLRWFFYGAAVDGTAYVSTLGGAVTRREMREALENMIACDLDFTGSLYWWPKGVNQRRCIARCSQGQGSWNIQGIEQWLGLHYDALKRELIFCPQGLATAYQWKNAHLGHCRIDVNWREDLSGTHLHMHNLNDFVLHVRVGVRSQDCGCDGPLFWEYFTLQPGEEMLRDWPRWSAAHEATVDIPATETKLLSRDGVVFDAPGFMMPSAEQEVNAFLLRYVWIPTDDCRDASIRLIVPEGWGVLEKEERVWTSLDEMPQTEAVIPYSHVSAHVRIVAPFWVKLPKGTKRENVWSNVHPFAFPPIDEPHELYAASENPAETQLRAVLTYRDKTGIHETERLLPVKLLNQSEYETRVHRIIYGHGNGFESKKLGRN